MKERCKHKSHKLLLNRSKERTLTKLMLYRIDLDSILQSVSDCFVSKQQQSVVVN